MPATKIADIIIPELFIPYMQERTREKSALFQSGIIEQTEQYDSLASGGGNTVHMPFFQDLSGDSEILSDSTPLAVNKITTSQDIAVKHYRGRAWGANDLAKALSGADPMAAIADLVATWWGRDMQKALVNALNGIFATTLAATHVLDVAINDGNAATSANKLTAETTIDAFNLLGDETEALTSIAMHSRLYYNLMKADLIQFERLSEQGNPIASYLGKSVIVDDSLPRVAGSTSGFKYTSYLFGSDAIAYGEGNPNVPVETDRDSLQGEDYLINRRHFLLHPKGVKWTGNAAGTSPTNAELATGGNWSKVYENKNIKIVKVVTNG